MLYIDKKNICNTLELYKKVHKNCNYSDFRKHENCSDSEIKEKEETYNSIKNDLYNEQSELCCYCCSKISIDNSTIEHIAPQDKYPKLTMQYENMLLSCNNNETCNRAKKNNYDENKFISPLDKNCEKYFEFNIYTGEIVSSNQNAVKSNYTISVLNLNSIDLREKRMQVIKKINQRMKYKNCTKESIVEYYVMKKRDMSDVVKYYISTLK